MTLNEDAARNIADQFLKAEPDARYKQARPVSSRELVNSMYESIMAKRKAGYTFEGIAALLKSLGAPMSVSTLKSYLLAAGRNMKSEAATVTRKDGPQKAPKARTNTRDHSAAKTAARSSRERVRTGASNAGSSPPQPIEQAAADVLGSDAGSSDGLAAELGRHAASTTKVVEADAATDKAKDDARSTGTNGAAKTNADADGHGRAAHVAVPAKSTGSFGFVPRNR